MTRPTLSDPPVLDCRGLDPSRVEDELLSAFDRLAPSEILTLEVRGDGGPLLATLRSRRAGRFEWSPAATAEGLRVEVTRRADPAGPREVTEALGWDHDRLEALDQRAFAAREAGDLGEARRLFGIFAGGLRRHIGFEEQILFPEFERLTGLSPQAGPTAVMRAEHREIESLLEAIAEGIGDPAAPVDEVRSRLHGVLGDHNLKEEQVLYPGTDRMLSEAERDDLVARIQGFPA